VIYSVRVQLGSDSSNFFDKNISFNVKILEPL
jgi:hypothetical protein